MTEEINAGTSDPMTLMQGDLGLLASEVARRLLLSRIPARFARIRALRANPAAAVTIDTETFPPEVLTIHGRVEISEAEGIPAEYASAARAIWVTKRLGRILPRSTSPSPGWPGSIFIQPGWACTTFNRGFRARSVASHE